MDIIFTITTVTILLTSLCMVIMVFRRESILAGLVCLFVFPCTYYFVIYDFKHYSIPFYLHALGFIGYWVTVSIL